MKCVDWREVNADIISPLYEAERARWSRRLDWDATANWVLVEAARRHGSLPGYVVLDRHRTVAGWAFYALHDEILQIGGLSARTGSIARCLLDTIMRSPEAGRAAEISCFVLPDKPAAAAFVQRRFDALTFLYLRRALDQIDAIVQPDHQTAGADGSVRVTPWRGLDDAPDTVRLMAAAYGSGRAARCFAGRGGVDGWIHYVRQLIRTPACGVLLPTASFGARTSDGRLCGVVLTTSIGPRAAHVAQLVVDPTHARRGLGRRLLHSACVAACEEGRRFMTLLVADDNKAARGLYARTGFDEQAQFLFGWRARPIPRTTTRAA